MTKTDNALPILSRAQLSHLESHEAFLRSLPGPCFIHVPGKDSTRCRVAVTLLHGNEPSGLKGFLAWLQQDIRPAVDCYVGIISTHAALAEPIFTHRSRPSDPDINRCFAPPFNGVVGVLAEQVIQVLETLRPEAVIDIHNTSGFGPHFAISHVITPLVQTVAGLFTKHLIETHIKLNSLMEVQLADCDIVTIECGGALDPTADKIAYNGLCRFFEVEQILSEVALCNQVELARHPIRIELTEGASLQFGEGPENEVDLTLPIDAERFNFNTMMPQQALGWVGKRGLTTLLAKNAAGDNVVSELFQVSANTLFPKVPMKLFMVTTRVDIALSDCLFYVCPTPSEG